VERFKQPKDQSLGPGIYNAKDPSHLRSRSLIPAFASSDTRIQKRKENGNPGPGQYNSKDIINSLSSKTWGKKGIFGSSERRFLTHQANKDMEEEPGPGAYQADKSVKNLDLKKFASNKKT